jgi:hypothetical protein
MRRLACRTLRPVAMLGAAVLAAGLLTTGGAGPVAAKAVSPSPCAGKIELHPRSDVFFTNPLSRSAAEHDAITRAMVRLICSVTPVPATAKHHPVIELAAYLFNNAPSSNDGVRDDGSIGTLVKALVWAQNYAHAHVRVVFDGGVPHSSYPAPNPSYTMLHNPAGGLKNPSKVVICNHSHHDTSCSGDNIMHSKLLLVSHVGRRGRPAMIVTSQNLTPDAETDTYNNAVQLVGGHRAFMRYHRYFKTLLEARQHPNIGSAMGSTTPRRLGGAAVTSYFFPRNDPSYRGRIKHGRNRGFPKRGHADTPHQDARVDSVASVLSQVTDCWNPGVNPGYARVPDALDHMPPDRTLIQIAMYLIHDRPQIIRQLQRLVLDGCDVQLVYSRTDLDTYRQLAPLQGPNFRMWQSVRPDVANPSWPIDARCVFLHSKYTLISGSINGRPNQNLVLTGSENWTSQSLHNNDESMVQIAEHGRSPIYSKYARHFARIDRPDARHPNAHGVNGCILYASPGLLQG